VWRLDGESLSITPGMGLLHADVAFPVLHGPFGEDGSIQGLLEMLDVAYVGAGVAASAVCLDKVLFKELMGARGIPQVGYVGVRAESYASGPAAELARIAGLGLPVFVKPAHLGSSVGIAKVAHAGEMAAALEQAFAHDELVIVEAAARGAEVECGVLGALPGDRAVASLPGEILFDGEWYDYAAKYTPGAMRLRVPAAVSAAALERVRELAVQTFLACECEGLARVDFFVDGEEVLVNELNTMPGFTPTSVYAKLLEASGVPYAELLDRLCRLALDRRRRRAARLH
jgi:D-alanine-D-alanine ligase